MPPKLAAKHGGFQPCLSASEGGVTHSMVHFLVRGRTMLGLTLFPFSLRDLYRRRIFCA